MSGSTYSARTKLRVCVKTPKSVVVDFFFEVGPVYRHSIFNRCRWLPICRAYIDPLGISPVLTVTIRYANYQAYVSRTPRPGTANTTAVIVFSENSLFFKEVLHRHQY
jgi:hypothetical protein